MTDPFAAIVRNLLADEVRFIVIGVWGINYYARSSATLFTTLDRDLFLPGDASNLLRAWQSCQDSGLTLWSSNEPLDSPRDLVLARRVIEHRGLTSAINATGALHIDLSPVMAGFAFDDVWTRRRVFVVDGVEIPVAALTDIITSKLNAGRDKDALFLATYEEALRRMTQQEDFRSGQE